MLVPLQAHVDNRTALGQAIEALVQIEATRGEIHTALFNAKLDLKVNDRAGAESLDVRVVSIFVTSPWGALDIYDVEKIMEIMRSLELECAVSIENSGLRLIFRALE